MSRLSEIDQSDADSHAGSHKRRDKRCHIAAPLLEKALVQSLEQHQVSIDLKGNALSADHLEESHPPLDGVQRDDLQAEVEKRLRAIEAVDDQEGNGEVGIFRISHLGGHRYAGVMIVSSSSSRASIVLTSTADLLPLWRNPILRTRLPARDPCRRQGDDPRRQDLAGPPSFCGKCGATGLVGRRAGDGKREGCQGCLSKKGQEFVNVVDGDSLYSRTFARSRNREMTHSHHSIAGNILPLHKSHKFRS